MGLIAWLVFGLLAGAFARLIVRGGQKIGCLATLAVGVAGAFLGGLIGNVILGHPIRFGFHLVPFLLAVVGAVVLLLLIDALSGRRRGRLF